MFPNRLPWRVTRRVEPVEPHFMTKLKQETKTADQAAEFDAFAGDYQDLHARNISISGEEPAYFAEYKVRVVDRLVGDEKIGSVVDFGSGVGASVPFFQQYLPDAKLTCLDVSEASLAQSRAVHGPGISFLHYDGDHIPLEDNAVDLVFAACVFHHIDADAHAGALANIKRILKPGGHFFLFEHNPLNPLTVRAVNTCEFDEDAVLIRAPRMYSRIREAGFSRLRRDYCVFFPAALSALRPMEQYLSWLPLGAQYFIWGRA